MTIAPATPAELAAAEIARYCDPRALARAHVVGAELADEVCIPPAQRTVHVVSEAIAVFVGVPFLLWAATTSSSPAARAGLRTMAVATIAIDGGLLLTWLMKK